MESPTYSEIANSTADIHAVILSHKGSIAFEYYRKPEYSYNLHPLYSITKSVVALGMWFVIQKHGLGILNEPILNLCKGYPSLPSDERWQKLTLHHLLSQTSGLQWKEMGAKWGPGNPLWEMEHHHDWVSYVFQTRLIANPGRHFNYCSGASHLIPFVMQHILERDISEMFVEEFFFPIGIDRLLWEADPLGNPAGGKGLHLRPHDLLKIGDLILNKGRVGLKEIISAEWITSCMSVHSHGMPFYGEYGYQWWLHPDQVVAATGFGGQNLIVDFKSELLGVFVGNLGKVDLGLPLQWFQNFKKQFQA